MAGPGTIWLVTEQGSRKIISRLSGSMPEDAPRPWGKWGLLDQLKYRNQTHPGTWMEVMFRKQLSAPTQPGPTPQITPKKCQRNCGVGYLACLLSRLSG